MSFHRTKTNNRTYNTSFDHYARLACVTDAKLGFAYTCKETEQRHRLIAELMQVKFSLDDATFLKVSNEERQKQLFKKLEDKVQFKQVMIATQLTLSEIILR